MFSATTIPSQDNGLIPTPKPGTQLIKLTLGLIKASPQQVLISWTNTGNSPYTVSYAGQSFTTTDTTYAVPGINNGGSVTVTDSAGQSYTIQIPTYPSNAYSQAGLPTPQTYVAPSINVSTSGDGLSASLSFNNFPNVPVQLSVNGSPVAGTNTNSSLMSLGYTISTNPGASYTVDATDARFGTVLASVSFNTPAPITVPSSGTSTNPLTSSYTILGITLPGYGWAGIALAGILILRK